MRIYHASIYDYDDIDNSLKDKVISLHNERQVAETLIRMCTSSLSEYKTTGKVIFHETILVSFIHSFIFLNKRKIKLY